MKDIDEYSAPGSSRTFNREAEGDREGPQAYREKDNTSGEARGYRRNQRAYGAEAGMYREESESNESSIKTYKQERRYGQAMRMRQRAMNAGNYDTLTGVEEIFEAKLLAIQSYERKLTTINDPYARKVLMNMIEEERRQLVNMSELAELVEQGPEMNGFKRTGRRLNHLVKTQTGKNLGFWLGAATLGIVLLPTVRDKLRPLAVSAVQGVMGLTEQAQGVLSGIREDIEDLVCEAQFEKYKEAVSPVNNEPGE